MGALIGGIPLAALAYYSGRKSGVRDADDLLQLAEIESISNRYGWQIIEQEIDKDHIHILIRYSPKWSVLEIVRLLKQLTTYRIWEKHSEYLSRHFWKEHTFWSDGYFSCSIGNVSKEIIQKYIQTQGS